MTNAKHSHSAELGTHRPKLTKNQTLVFGALSKATEPLSAYAILDQLRSQGFRAPLQVYRALDKLTDIGLVHRLESLNAFVACNDPHCTAHESAAFAICETCGKAIEFSDESTHAQLEKWARQNAFSLNAMTIELRGICAKCG